MCAVVEGYKLFTVTTASGEQHNVAGQRHSEVLNRAAARGIQSVDVRWHSMYREYAQTEDAVDRSIIKLDIEDMIWDDIVNYAI